MAPRSTSIEMFQEAIATGDVKLMKKLHVKIPIPKNTDVTHGLVEHRIRFDNGFRSSDHLDMIKFLHTKGYPFNYIIAHEAAKTGDLKVIKYIIGTKGSKNELDYDKYGICDNAAHLNQLEMMKYLVSKGCVPNEDTCSIAAAYGYIKMVTYLHENGCPWDEDTCTASCSRVNGNMVLLKYAHEHGCPWNEEACEEAAKNGYLNSLKYLHENGCPWDDRTCEATSENGHFECLKYAHENGCPWNFETAKWSVEYGRYENVAYILKHDGVPKIDLPFLLEISQMSKKNDHKMVTRALEKALGITQSNAIRKIGNKSPKCNDNDCAICQQKLDIKPSKGGYGQLECSHCFHVDCLFEWYDKGKTTCPMCRHEFVEHNDTMLRGGAKAKKQTSKLKKVQSKKSTDRV